MKLKIIIRRLFKQKLNSGIIISSLVIGIACVTLISIFIRRELSTDKFHEDHDNIYALAFDDPFEPGNTSYYCLNGSAEYIKDNYSQVEDFCRILGATPEKVIANKESFFDKPKTIAVSENFFEFFSYELISNNSKLVLETEKSLVISEDLANKYFGNGKVIGQHITLIKGDEEEQMIVSGVFRKPIQNSQLSFDMVRLIGEQDSHAFIKLTQDANPIKLEDLLDTARASIPIVHINDHPGQYYLRTLSESYFDVSRREDFEVSRNKPDLWVALLISLMILGIATFNYMGLLNNQLTERMSEYSIRRVNGSTRFGLIIDFLAENIIVILISLLISLPLIIFILPYFNSLIGTELSLKAIFSFQQLLVPLSIHAFLTLISFTFIFHALVIRKRQTHLKPVLNDTRSTLQTPTFNIIQLALSIVLIISSIVIIKQINFISEKAIGMNKDVMAVLIPQQHVGAVKVFKEKLLQYAAVDRVSITNSSPVKNRIMVLCGYDLNGKTGEYILSGFNGDEDYVKTLGLELIEGNEFDENPEANQDKCLINQSLAKEFPDENLIGKKLPGLTDLTVVGIVKDFHYSSLQSYVEPAYVMYYDKGRHLLVKPSLGQNNQTQAAIANVWEEVIPDYPLAIESIADHYESLHEENRNYVKLIGACCSLSVFLSMIGLFAISFRNGQLRTKEIGIRKVNGARIWEMMMMLNKDFVKWVIIAFVIACPVAWFGMSQWLEDFAYRTELSWWIFALAGIIALGIALLTVSWQSWRTATRNPVEALRYE